MSKPKNMTLEEEQAWKIRQKDYKRKVRESWTPEEREAWNLRNRKHQQKFRENNKDRIKLWLKNWKEKNPERVRYLRRTSARRNPETTSIRGKRPVKNLTVAYVAQRLGLPKSVAQQHPDLIETKREQLKALRQLKTQTKKQNAPESK